MKKLYILCFTFLISSISFGQVLGQDGFAYSDGSLVPNGGWASTGGTSGDLLISSGMAVVQHGTPSEDVNLPFTPVSGNIYYALDFSVDDLGAPYDPAKDLGGSGGPNDFEYFAHFKVGFDFSARLDIVAPTGGGDFSVGIASDQGTADAVWATDLTYGVTYRAIVRYDQDNNIAELWIDASVEGDTSIMGADQPNPGDSVAGFSLRQSDSSENETIRVDNLMVGQSFNDVLVFVPSTTPTITITSPADFAVLPTGTTSVDIVFTTANLNTGDQVDITVTINGGTPSTFTNQTSPYTIMGTVDGDTFEVTAEIVNGATQIDFETIDFSIDIIVATDLVINEFLADPAAGVPDGDSNGDGVREGSEDEFIEIYNSGVSSIDLEGYTISDGFAVRHTFTGTVLAAGSFIIVFGGGTPTGISGISQVASTGLLGLNNGGDTVTLRDGGGVKRLEETYGGEGGNNQSLARNPDFTGSFVEHTSIVANAVNFSPGVRNDGTLSTNDFYTNNFKLFPNPTSLGYVNISSKNGETINANVYDILGKQVINSTVINNKLDVSNLNTGVYIMRLTQNNATITKKLVIN